MKSLHSQQNCIYKRNEDKCCTPTHKHSSSDTRYRSWIQFPQEDRECDGQVVWSKPPDPPLWIQDQTGSASLSVTLVSIKSISYYPTLPHLCFSKASHIRAVWLHENQTVVMTGVRLKRGENIKRFLLWIQIIKQEEAESAPTFHYCTCCKNAVYYVMYSLQHRSRESYWIQHSLRVISADGVCVWHHAGVMQSMEQV